MTKRFLLLHMAVAKSGSDIDGKSGAAGNRTPDSAVHVENWNAVRYT